MSAYLHCQSLSNKVIIKSICNHGQRFACSENESGDIYENKCDKIEYKSELEMRSETQLFSWLPQW
jgi:hypothetical protein